MAAPAGWSRPTCWAITVMSEWRSFAVVELSPWRVAAGAENRSLFTPVRRHQAGRPGARRARRCPSTWGVPLGRVRCGDRAVAGSAADGSSGAGRRQVVNGILRKLSTGAAWRDLPERYGPWKTICERFRRWSADGTCDRLLAHAQQHSDAVGAVDWTVVCLDSTTVRAHQHAAGARKRGRTGRARHSAGPAAG